MGKKIWFVIAIVVAVVMVYFWINKGPSNVSEQLTNPSSSPNQPAKTTIKKPASTATSSKTYSDLVNEYIGRRIQFDERCQVIPSNPTYKNMTSIMLDNRSNTAKVVKIGNTPYSLSGFGYKVVTLSSSSLPQELNVSCGSSGNVGKILLQALISQ